MKKLKELLQKEKMIWIELEQKNKKEFLNILEKHNFKWLNGKTINHKKDEIFFHASIDIDNTLSNVPMFAWLSKESKKIKKLKFDDFIKLI